MLKLGCVHTGDALPVKNISPFHSIATVATMRPAEGEKCSISVDGQPHQGKERQAALVLIAKPWSMFERW